MDNFHDILRKKIKEYAHLVYKITREYPKEELYGLTAQTRRAVISGLSNYIEGYARFKLRVMINFYEIAYGSIKETDIQMEFAYEEGYIKKEEDYILVRKLADEILAMLWKTIEGRKNED